ncbi:serum amyloid P-component-like [Podarcis raffonei]|uniref:serum amyloid P-component-like n=1 Tax=Podarcis raffonei TaxID=65483 RepID=UPI00232998BF|nr:serum amyloid P-component-like [Podarcis raffonei]
MEILHSSLVILACLLGSLAQEDLQTKVFIFPASSNTAAVVLNASFQDPLTSVTVCLRSYTLLNRNYGLFSYATRKSDNELLIFKPKLNQYNFYVGGTSVTFSVPERMTSGPQWEHICMSWESATGLVEFWLDGQPLPRMGMKKGYSIGTGGSLLLAQDQDSVGGGFDINQSFTGELTDVYMWDRVLTPDEVLLIRNGGTLSKCILNWRSLSYQMKGYVVVKPSLKTIY